MNSREVARTIAAESIVLLKNENQLLPLAPGTKAVFFGRAQEDTIFSGNGSGAAHFGGGVSILTACEQAGIFPEPKLAAYYRAQVAAGVGKQPEIDWSQAGDCVNSGLIYELFGQYRAPSEEYVLTEEQLVTAAAFSDTAILVLGRNSGGEECDRHLEDDYYLTASERKLVEDVCSRFPKVILVLNIIGLIDLSWTEQYPQIQSILFLGIPGEQGMHALADILVGTVNPSGHLAFTIARSFGDYPSAKNFTWDKYNEPSILTYESYGLDAAANGSHGYAISPITVYQEDIYAGYRYFDAFRVAPLYPFGYGLSYTRFSQETVAVTWDQAGSQLTIRVKNEGNKAGKHVVQVYLAARTEQKRPAKQLVGFAKTQLLAPGEEADVQIAIRWKELASYREDRAAWEIGRGEYLLLVGEDSRSLCPAVNVTVPENLTVSRCSSRLTLQTCNAGKINFLQPPVSEAISHSAPWNIVLSEISAAPKMQKHDSYDVVKALTDLELAALCVGYGPGIPFSAFLKEKLPNTAELDGVPLTVNSHPVGFNGYVSPAIPEKGIYSAFYKDGPAGIGETAWPTEMLMACSFNRELWYAFGDAVGTECEKQQVDVWLAPAVNLLRHPLGGRSFEFFSEDPFLTGTAAVHVARGVQEQHKVLVCPKHFTANEQETFRRGNGKRNIDAVDSIVTEQALRELYLKPFQMLAEDGNIHCIMTSFNKINGTFTGGSRDLCTHILREEWGFDGVVVTDWGDMDTVVDGADAVAAGNDVIMPGGPPVIRQILAGLQDGRLTREAMETAVQHLLVMTAYTGRTG